MNARKSETGLKGFLEMTSAAERVNIGTILPILGLALLCLTLRSRRPSFLGLP